MVESLERDFDGHTELADERGTTPLLLASALGKAEIVEALMERSGGVGFGLSRPMGSHCGGLRCTRFSLFNGTILVGR